MLRVSFSALVLLIDRAGSSGRPIKTVPRFVLEQAEEETDGEPANARSAGKNSHFTGGGVACMVTGQLPDCQLADWTDDSRT